MRTGTSPWSTRPCSNPTAGLNLPLLRIAHGNDTPASLLPRAGEGAQRADEGARTDTFDATQSRSPSPQPSPASGRGGQSLSRDDAKRAFDEAILERLVALNAERAAEEARGHVRWLRPDFQNPQATAQPDQGTLATTRDDATDTTAEVPVAIPREPWPKDTVQQVRAVAALLDATVTPLSLDDITNRFTARGAWKKRVPAILDMLVTLGHAHERAGRYSP